MSRYILISIILALVYIPNSLAWDMPYGVQDPMLGSGGWANCSGGEIGHWNVVQRQSPDGRKAIYLVLTTVDFVDPAFIICIVPPDRKVAVMEPGKAI